VVNSFDIFWRTEPVASGESTTVNAPAIRSSPADWSLMHSQLFLKIRNSNGGHLINHWELAKINPEFSTG
jgi:hypothetical protein